jgi:drug/metabolite transporter (DMT)-like permease
MRLDGERSMRQAFQAFLAFLGVIVIAISIAHLAIGPRAIIGSVAVNPTMAGEDRFFAGLLLCYGIALLWCARDVQRKRVYVNVLAAGFFVGGIGRLLAILIDGPPNPFYLAMLVLELALPPLMVVIAGRVASPS